MKESIIIALALAGIIALSTTSDSGIRTNPRIAVQDSIIKAQTDTAITNLKILDSLGNVRGNR